MAMVAADSVLIMPLCRAVSPSVNAENKSKEKRKSLVVLVKISYLYIVNLSVAEMQD